MTAPLLLGFGYLAVNPQRMYALFGFGDIVFDPSSYASLGKIWSQDISNGAKLAETYNQTVKIVKNGLELQPRQADGGARPRKKRLGNGGLRRRK